jgi:PAS domain S-box-containing protein
MSPTGVDRMSIEPRRVLVAAIVVVVAAFFLVTQSPALPQAWRVWIVDLSWTAAALLAGARSLLTATRSQGDDRVAFTLFGLGGLSWYFGMLVWNYHELWLGQLTPFPSLADIGFLLAAPLFTIGLIAYLPPAPRPGRIIIRIGNLGMIATALAAILVIQLQQAIQASPYGTLYNTTALAWPMAFGVAAAFGLFAWSADHWGARQVIIRLLVLGVIVHALGAMLYGEQLLLSLFATGGEIDGIWMVAFALQYAAAVEQDRLSDRKRLEESSGSIVMPADVALPAFLLGLLLLSMLVRGHELTEIPMGILVPLGLAFALFLALRDWWVRRVTVALRAAELAALRQLAAGERRLRNVFDTTSDGLLVVDDDGRVRDANPAAAVLFDLPVDVLRDRRLSDLVGPDPARNILDIAASGAVFRCDVAVVRPGGEPTPVNLVASRFEAAQDEPGLGLTLHDLSEEREAEEGRRRTARMEAISQVTAGVAHDFNNLLTVIIGNAETLEERALRHGDTEPLASEILAAAERCANLTRRLLAYTRQQPLHSEAVEIAKVINSAVLQATRDQPRNIEVVVEPPPSGVRALVDGKQLELAITSLVHNAREAMPDGGTIRIRAAEAEVTEEMPGPDAELTPGRYVMISIADSGIGMPPEHEARAFEPFFTTKAFGQSAGLGLPAVYGFAKQSSGHVELSTSPGQGTTVTLWLPRA